MKKQPKGMRGQLALALLSLLVLTLAAAPPSLAEGYGRGAGSVRRQIDPFGCGVA
jgi:hypothetical protein